MQWYTIKNARQSDLNEISADIRVQPDSPWFCGHFPGEPILPGIAQLGMVFEVVNQLCGQNLKITSINRVRFKQIIRPNDYLKIIAIPLKEEAGSYSFHINVDGEKVCSGMMTVEKRGEPGNR